MWTDKDINGKEFKPLEGQTKARDIREKTKSGFGATIFPSGKISFIYFYQFEGRKRRMTLGKYPQCTLAEARKSHRNAQRALEAGKDPAFEERKEKNAARDASTINALIEEYIEKWAKPNKRSWEADQRCLERNIKKPWGKRKAAEITRRDVNLLLDEIKDRGALVQANRVLACIRKMFNFAIERDLLQSNPCTGIKATKENSCDRVLTEDELRIIWLALSQKYSPEDLLHTLHMSEQTKLILKLQLVTAQRKGEVVEAEWSEIDLKSSWWTIPASKAKNNQAHRVPLSSLAIEILQDIKILSGDSRFLFPAQRGDKHITAAAIDHAVRRSRFEGVAAWTPHDCRRTAASYMTSIGIPRLTVTKILNHSENNSVTAIYDRHSYDNEKRIALEEWAQKLRKTIYCTEFTDNVVALKAVI